MTALRKIQVEQEPDTNAVSAPRLQVVSHNEALSEAKPKASALKNVALFLFSPFLGLAYIIALPFVGMAVIAVLAARAAAKYDAVRMVGRALKPVAAMIGGPLLGLAYVVFFPFIGLGALVWVAGKAATAKN